MNCPRCQRPVSIFLGGKSKKWIAQHAPYCAAVPCPWTMGSWHGATREEVESRVASDEPIQASDDRRQFVLGAVSIRATKQRRIGDIRATAKRLKTELEELSEA